MGFFEVEDRFPALMAIINLFKVTEGNNSIAFASHQYEGAVDLFNAIPEIELRDFEGDFLFDFRLQIRQEQIHQNLGGPCSLIDGFADYFCKIDERAVKDCQ